MKSTFGRSKRKKKHRGVFTRKIVIVVAFLLLSFFNYGQQVVQKGNFLITVNNDTVSGRIGMPKAQADAFILRGHHPDAEIFIHGPKWEVGELNEVFEVSNEPCPPFYLMSHRVYNITETSAEFEFILSDENWEHAIFAIKKKDDTLDWISVVYEPGVNIQHTGQDLEPNTTYIYTFWANMGTFDINMGTREFKTN